MTASLKNIIETDDITLDVHIGVLNRVAYTSLGSEVHHHIKLMISKEFINQCLIGNATLCEAILMLWVLCSLFINDLQSVILQTGIVIVVQVIKAHNGYRLLAFQESQNQISANEPGTAGNKYCFHFFIILISTLLAQDKKYYMAIKFLPDGTAQSVANQPIR